MRVIQAYRGAARSMRRLSSAAKAALRAAGLLARLATSTVAKLLWSERGLDAYRPAISKSSLANKQRAPFSHLCAAQEG